jgi:regulator of sigma E protease
MVSSAALYVTSAVVLLGVLIFFHELGHFILAKALGVKVERFSIGLGPSLWSRKYGETEYILAAIPFGGYIKMLGEHTSLEDMGQEDVEPPTEEELKRSFDRQPVWKRSTIILMGPLFNIVLAALIFIGIFAINGQSYLLAKVDKVEEGSPAQSAGIMPGDLVTAVGGKPVGTWNEMAEAIQASGPGSMSFEVLRDDTSLEVFIEPETRIINSPLGGTESKLLVGIMGGREYVTEEVGFLRAIRLGTEKTFEVGSLIFEVLLRLVRRIIPADTIGGPILIFKMAGESAQHGPVEYLVLMAVISVNLGVLNLLPIPVLDGGHLVFMGIEAVRRRPLSENVVMNAQRIGIALLLTLMLFATYNDIIRWITGKWTP